MGWDHEATTVVDVNEWVQGLTNTLDLVGTITALWGFIHPYMKEGELPKVEWNTIGQVPEIKELPKPVSVVAQRPVVYEELEVNSKEQLPMGTKVRTPDGREGVTLVQKAVSGSGYVYTVRVEKRD